ncbi:MAG: DUF4279 domain-containing protein [Opitutaceae bacterium]
MSFPLPTATLRLSGDQLDPEEISRAISAKPSRSHRMGETLRLASGKERRAKSGAWILFADDFDRHHEIGDSVASILDKIKYPKSLAEISGVETGYIALALRINEQAEAGILPPEIVSRIAQLGLGLSFEVYAD